VVGSVSFKCKGHVAQAGTGKLVPQMELELRLLRDTSITGGSPSLPGQGALIHQTFHTTDWRMTLNFVLAATIVTFVFLWIVEDPLSGPNTRRGAGPEGCLPTVWSNDYG